MGDTTYSACDMIKDYACERCGARAVEVSMCRTHYVAVFHETYCPRLNRILDRFPTVRRFYHYHNRSTGTRSSGVRATARFSSPATSDV